MEILQGKLGLDIQSFTLDMIPLFLTQVMTLHLNDLLALE